MPRIFPVTLCLTALLVLAPAPLPAADAPTASGAGEKTHLTVYKTPTCGCCGAWIEHLEARGFTTDIRHPRNLNEIKAGFGIPIRYQSCHTAVSDDGYIFEGHIPAAIINRFLAEPPADAIGLTVPAMPVGSPGMESGNRFMPYQILLLKKSGATELYAEVMTREEQY